MYAPMQKPSSAKDDDEPELYLFNLKVKDKMLAFKRF